MKIPQREIDETDMEYIARLTKYTEKRASIHLCERRPYVLWAMRDLQQRIGIP